MPWEVPAWEHLGFNIGRFLRFFVGACAPDPFIMLETAAPALVRAAIGIAEPDIKEAFHKLRGNSLLHEIRVEAESEKIAEDELGGKVLKHLFRLGAATDYAIWMAFLGSVAAEGVIEFTSQLMKISPCLHRYPPYCGYGYDNIGASYVGGWNPMGEFAITMPSVFGPIWPPVYTASRDNFIAVGWWGTPKDFFGNPAGGATRLIDTTTGTVWAEAANTQNEDGSWTSLAGWHDRIPVFAGHSYTIQGMGTSPVPDNEVFWSGSGCWIAPESGE